MVRTIGLLRRRMPWGLVGLLGTIVLVESSFSAPRWAGQLGLNCRFAAAEAATEARDAAVLVFGDSQAKVGILPEVVEQRLGRPTYNLAVLASPAPLSYFLLRRAITAGAAPEAIVVGHMTLAARPGRNTPHYAELLGPGEFLDLTFHHPDFNDLSPLILGRLLPSVRARLAVRRVIVTALRDGTVPPGTIDAAGIWRHWADRRGGYETPVQPGYDGRMEPELERTLYSIRWRVSSLNAGYFDRLVGLAERHHIKVFWLVAPIVPAAQRHRDALGLDAAHTRNLRALQARHPGLVVVDARRLGLSGEYFIDSCHLNARGARVLSARLADAIGAHLDGTPARLAWETLGADPPPLRTADGSTAPDAARRQ